MESPSMYSRLTVIVEDCVSIVFVMIAYYNNCHGKALKEFLVLHFVGTTKKPLPSMYG
jgi:hypothetical protein